MSEDLMPVIETNRTILRQLVPADAGELFAKNEIHDVRMYSIFASEMEDLA